MAAVSEKDSEKPFDATRVSDAEKDLKTEDRLAGFADPDAGLSEEERAKIVCNSFYPYLALFVPRCPLCLASAW